MPPMKGTLSVRKAIWLGLAWVNGPVFILLVGPLLAFGQLIKQGYIDRQYNWVGVVLFPAGFVLAWLWWSFNIPRWRLWAYEQVVDIRALKCEAVAVGLTWPDGHVFGKTEIKSKTHAQREQALDQPLSDEFDDDESNGRGK